MQRRTAVLSTILAFALFESALAVWYVVLVRSVGLAGAIQLSPQLASLFSNPIFGYSPQLSVAGWSSLALIVAQGRVSRRSQIKNIFLNRGLSSDVYDLMVGMRGGTSRLALLQSLETPRHRQELAEVTGIDWKEVDRELGILEKYGLVKMYAQSGSVKLYQTTEQGGLLVKLIEELNNRN